MLMTRYYTLVVCGIFFLSCNWSFAQKKPDIKGNRTVAVVDKALDAFNSIVVEEDLDISFKKAVTPSVHFVADDNLPPVFNFSVKDSVLHISSYYRIKSKKELQITVSYVNLKSIQLKEGRVKLDINSNTIPLDINAKGRASIEVYGIADRLSVNLLENSKMKLTSTLNQLEIDTKDKSSIDFSGVITNSKLNLEDRSVFNALGSCTNLFLTQTQDSYFNGKGLKVETAELHLNNNATSDLYAIKEVDLYSNHQSILNFYGTASLEVKEFLGSAQILKKAFNTTQE